MTELHRDVVVVPTHAFRVQDASLISDHTLDYVLLTQKYWSYPALKGKEGGGVYKGWNSHPPSGGLPI